MKSRREVPKVGTQVRFTFDNLGANKDNTELGLCRTTGETYGVGDRGIVAFPHPNARALPDWFYVEVESKDNPGEKRYVGVCIDMVECL